MCLFVNWEDGCLLRHQHVRRRDRCEQEQQLDVSNIADDPMLTSFDMRAVVWAITTQVRQTDANVNVGYHFVAVGNSAVSPMVVDECPDMPHLSKHDINQNPAPSQHP